MDKDKTNAIMHLIDLGIIKIEHVKDINLVKSLRKDLDYGESEAIALSLELDSDLIIIDEIDARKMAEIYDLKKIGFLGILIKAKSDGIIENVKTYLDEVIEKGFWINKHLYKDILTRLNEI
jgi:hypothetical protein